MSIVNSKLAIQLSISAFALVCAGAHLLLPEFSFDGMAITLLVLAASPWLLRLLKSVELPGGFKVEFRDLQETERRAENVGLLDEIPDPATLQDYSFQVVAREDPNLALAGLRIEIEKRLVRLSQRTENGTTKMGVGKLLRLLNARELLTREESSVLADMMGLLNSAAHGARVDVKSAEWALDVGPRLLATLDKRIDG